MITQIRLVTTWKAGECGSRDGPAEIASDYSVEGENALAAKLIEIAREQVIGRGIEPGTADWTRTEIMGALIDDLASNL